MEYGEAHIAFRLGSKPEDPDSVVQYFSELEFGLYASPAYVENYGLPKSIDECRNHRFVRFNGPNQNHSWHKWLNENVPSQCTVFRSRSTTTLDHALIGGNGIGLFPRSVINRYTDLIPVLEDVAQWREPLWLVTHVDLHRGAKVQAFLKTLRSAGYLSSINPLEEK